MTTPRLLATVAATGSLLAGCGGSPLPNAAGGVPQGRAQRATSYANCPVVSGGTGILPDGDFSQAMNPGDHNLTPSKGTIFAPDWKVSKGNIDFNGTTYWDMDGLCSVDLDGDLTVGSIESSAFRAGKGTYTLSFVMSGNGHCSPTIKMMEISIDRQFTTFSWNTASGYDVQNGDYATETWSFYAKPPLSVLKFVSEDPKGSGCGIVIAGISITKKARTSRSGRT